MKTKPQRTLKLQSFAKINLGLRIFDRRPDGYHNIESVMTPVYPCDEITLTTDSTISMTCTDPGLPCDGQNLCVRAADLLRQKAGAAEGVHIHLEKKIPIGAGLGGGSSNAATVLRGLCQLWELNIEPRDIISLAAVLGSDVPFFMRTGTAAISGRGDLLDYFDLDLPYWIALVYPGIHCSTPWAYGEIDRERKVPHESERAVLTPLREHLVKDLNFPERMKSWLKNDFEEIVIRRFPLVGEIREELNKCGAAFTQLSGSGSSVYGLFTEKTGTMRVCSAVAGRFEVYVTPPHFSHSLR